jgi:tubulin polyglutamylase TTLL6/13
MYNICRKSNLAQHLKRFQKEFPKEFNFFPKTWMYPADLNELIEYDNKKQLKQPDKGPAVVYICKPESGS